MSAIDRSYPWHIVIADSKHFVVSNDLSTNIKVGLKYAGEIKKLLTPITGDFVVSQAFYVKANGIKYYLVLSEQALPANVAKISHNSSSDEQVVYIQIAKKMICENVTLNCNAGFSLVDVWLFLQVRANIPTPGGMLGTSMTKVQKKK